MHPDKVLRGAMWTTTFFNVGASLLFLFPESLGQLAGLPVPVPRVYGLMLFMFVLLFGGMYFYVARQPVISRELVALGAIGKSGAVVSVVTSWLMGGVSFMTVVVVSGDLIFAAIFFWWLVTSGVTVPVGPAQQQ